MKKKIAAGAQKVTGAAKARPAETRWSIIGAAAGAILGLFVGSVGVAAMGGAAGIPATLLLGLIGAFVGNRYGISKDRPVA